MTWNYMKVRIAVTLNRFANHLVNPNKCTDTIEMRISRAPSLHAWWKDQPATSHEHSPLSLSCQI